jgi:hypothetical protein
MLICALMALIRITGMSDLMDHEQQRQGAYIMDAIQNHRWIMQIDEAGEIAAKPPMFTWIGAISTMLFGSPEPYAMRFVALLSTLITVLLAQRMAGKYFGPDAAVAVVVVYLISMPGVRQIWLARMDALLPLTTTAGVVAAWYAWERGRGWTWFWIAAAVGMLTKGPAGLLCAAPLVAVFWEGTSFKRLLKGRGHFLGITLFLILTVGWFLAAYFAIGKPIIHKLISEEFLDQAVRTNKGRFIGSRFYEPPFYLLIRNFPWCIFMCLGLWKVFLEPSSDPHARRFERFVACWLLIGMPPFCLLTHQRADLLIPLYVPASILAGRELAWLLDRFRRGLFPIAITAIVILGLTGMFHKYHYTQTPAMRQTRAIQQLAQTIKAKVGSDFPLTHIDDPVALDIELNTMRPLYYGPTKSTTGIFDKDRLATYDYDAAAKLLQGPAAAFVVTFNREEIEKRMTNKQVELHDLAQANLPDITLHILSNRTELRSDEDIALGVGPLILETHGLKWVHASGTDFSLKGSGSLSIENTDSIDHPVRVTHNGNTTERNVSGNSIWKITFP